MELDGWNLEAALYCTVQRYSSLWAWRPNISEAVFRRMPRNVYILHATSIVSAVTDALHKLTLTLQVKTLLPAPDDWRTCRVTTMQFTQFTPRRMECGDHNSVTTLRSMFDVQSHSVITTKHLFVSLSFFLACLYGASHMREFTLGHLESGQQSVSARWPPTCRLSCKLLLWVHLSDFYTVTRSLLTKCIPPARRCSFMRSSMKPLHLMRRQWRKRISCQSQRLWLCLWWSECLSK